MNDPEDQNVYAAPEVRVERPGEFELPDLRFMAVWERRRVVYNAVLVAEVVVVALVIGGGRWLGDVEFWELLAVGAFGANVCFCAGPVGEAYLRWIGLKGQGVGSVVFGLGMCVAIVATLGTLLVYPLAKAGF